MEVVILTDWEHGGTERGNLEKDGLGEERTSLVSDTVNLRCL